MFQDAEKIAVTVGIAIAVGIPLLLGLIVLTDVTDKWVAALTGQKTDEEDTKEPQWPYGDDLP